MWWSLAILIMIFALSAAIFHANSQDEHYKVHKAQQDALKRHHKMMARDRDEPRITAWWKSLRIGR